MTELVEKRKDSQVAREIEFALPDELSPQQRQDLVVEIVTSVLTSQGMVADVAIHPPNPAGNSKNHHAHVLLTMRICGPDGFGHKVREWNSKALNREWRVQLSKIQNDYLERFGHQARVDHRKLKEQGIDREPLLHIGPAANYCERRGIQTIRGNKLRQIIERNRKLELKHQRPSHRIFTREERRNNPAIDLEHFATLLAEHKRNIALNNIWRDLQKNRQPNSKYLRDLSRDDRDQIEINGYDYVKALINEFELNLELDRER